MDVVCVATPDRLHVPLAMDAIHAGKDVYCEKPLGHWSQFNLCRQFAEETASLKRIVQVGNQGNSSPAWGKVRELVQQGAIGRLQHILAGYYRDGDWGERMPIPDPEAVPGPELDWEGFLGDAPKVAFTVNRFFSWRKYLDYAGGPCTDLFPHVLTPLVSALGLNYPSLAVASGGIFKYNTYDREVPDTFNMALDYPEKASAVLMCTLANEYSTEPAIRGDEGTLTLQNAGAWESGFDSMTVIPKKGVARVVPGLKTESTPLHWKNFIHCVRTREKPVSDVEFALKVQAAMCMAMLAFLHKKAARFDPRKRRSCCEPWAPAADGRRALASGFRLVGEGGRRRNAARGADDGPSGVDRLPRRQEAACLSQRPAPVQTLRQRALHRPRRQPPPRCAERSLASPRAYVCRQRQRP